MSARLMTMWIAWWKESVILKPTLARLMNLMMVIWQRKSPSFKLQLRQLQIKPLTYILESKISKVAAAVAVAMTVVMAVVMAVAVVVALSLTHSTSMIRLLM